MGKYKNRIPELEDWFNAHRHELGIHGAGRIDLICAKAGLSSKPYYPAITEDSNIQMNTLLRLFFAAHFTDEEIERGLNFHNYVLGNNAKGNATRRYLAETDIDKRSFESLEKYWAENNAA